MRPFRRVGALVSKLREEWRELERASQPMPNPHPSTHSAQRRKWSWRKFFSLRADQHWQAIRLASTVWLEQLRDPRNPSIQEVMRKFDPDPEEEKSKGTGALLPSDSDLQQLLRKFGKFKVETSDQMKENMSANLDEMLRLVKANRSQFENVAKDRLGLMSESLKSFLQGYREGRDREREAVLKHDHALNEFIDFFEKSQGDSKTNPSTDSSPPNPSAADESNTESIQTKTSFSGNMNVDGQTPNSSAKDV